MDLRRITDWTLLTGTSIEIRRQGSSVCSGYVDAVTDDGTILWLWPPAQNRRLFEKAESYEAWATEDRAGFHYEVTKGLSRNAGQNPAGKDSPSATSNTVPDYPGRSYAFPTGFCSEPERPDVSVEHGGSYTSEE